MDEAWNSAVVYFADREDKEQIRPFRIRGLDNCKTLSVPSCHATRRHEGWDTARSPKPRQGKSRGRGRIRAFRSVNLRSNHLVHLASDESTKHLASWQPNEP
ncbi:hypothetical protein T265_03353 [Opisthorchis viverrini]|uniref:Uncharacterized protein n=1 Tax=Opisthorchis viverrini TaxID=6198 RepID=A0A074ZSY7_OPIVI|nr:hypothetical protein T265_03353 [Opisthorchis viverrini]KER30201.1 hypothetical protein T265_03353 [Opisthorchis viverrini]